MDLEELKERYKMLPMWARLLVAALIGLIPGGWIYYDEGDTLQAQLVTSQSNQEGARAKFEEARRLIARAESRLFEKSAALRRMRAAGQSPVVLHGYRQEWISPLKSQITEEKVSLTWTERDIAILSSREGRARYRAFSRRVMRLIERASKLARG